MPAQCGGTMHILEHIMARRSIRKFTAEPVDEEDIRNLLRAAMAAPSASNRKPWEFIVVTDQAVLGRLRRALPLGRYRSQCVIVVCGDVRRSWPGPGRDFWIQDGSAATQNILLAACGMGLGAVWVGVHPVGLFVKSVSRVLGLPKDVRPLGLIHVGYPAETKEPRTQYDEARVHWQCYDETKVENDNTDDTDAGVPKEHDE